MIDLNALAHSRDHLEIVQLDGQPCVRKTFKSNLPRAARCVRKQRQFKPLQTGRTHVAAAGVLSFVEGQDSAALTMPYVEGISGPDFAIHASRLLAETLSDALSTLVYAELARSTEQPCDTALFIAKIDEISAAICDPTLQALAKRAREKVVALPGTLQFPMGSCHGDLTLSNVIYTPASGITVIDFLDTFLETPLQDVAKLKQDFIYGWSFRKCAPALRVKAQILCQQHLPQALAQVERLYGVQVRLLTLLMLLRIAPYVRDDATTDWLVASLNDCLAIKLA